MEKLIFRCFLSHSHPHVHPYILPIAATEMQNTVVRKDRCRRTCSKAVRQFERWRLAQ